MKQLYFTILIALHLLVTASAPSIIFKENKGQWPEKVLFGTEMMNVKFYVNKGSFNYCVYNNEELLLSQGAMIRHRKPETVHGHSYEVNFIGADLTGFTKMEEQPEYYNYFLGKDKTNWVSNVKAFGSLNFKEVYR